MLEKIQNISSGNDFKAGNSYFAENFRRNKKHNQNFKDSLVLSHSLQLMLSLGWGIKEICSQNDRLKFCFLINNLEYYFDFNRDFLLSNKLAEFEVRDAEGIQENKLSLSFKSAFKFVHTDSESNQKEFIELPKLVSVFRQLLISSAFSKDNMEEFLGRVNEKIELEISFLLENLIKFTLSLMDESGIDNSQNFSISSETILMDVRIVK